MSDNTSLDPDLQKIEDEVIEFLMTSPLFMGEKPIFLTIKSYFITRESLTQKELKKLTGYSSGAISQELNRLVEKGMIEVSKISSSGEKTYQMKSIVISFLNYYLNYFKEIITL